MNKLYAWVWRKWLTTREGVIKVDRVISWRSCWCTMPDGKRGKLIHMLRKAAV